MILASEISDADMVKLRDHTRTEVCLLFSNPGENHAFASLVTGDKYTATRFEDLSLMVVGKSHRLFLHYSPMLRPEARDAYGLLLLLPPDQPLPQSVPQPVPQSLVSVPSAIPVSSPAPLAMPSTSTIVPPSSSEGLQN
jgi:hypothetical protein